MSKVVKETKVVPNEYRGHTLFSVFEFDKEGNQSEYPVISFAVNKAKVILKHLDELKKYVDDNS